MSIDQGGVENILGIISMENFTTILDVRVFDRIEMNILTRRICVPQLNILIRYLVS